MADAGKPAREYGYRIRSCGPICAYRWKHSRQPILRTEVLLKMSRQVAVVLYVVAMAAVIVGVDFVFFRHRFWERLMANIGIVLVFIAFYLRFLRRTD
jgi:hypothetical protein